MQVGELSPWLVRGLAAAVGAFAGIAGGRLADVLPPRYGVTLLATGRPRTRRNALLVVLACALALGLAEVTLAAPRANAQKALVDLAVALALGGGLLAGAAIDLEHMLLPNEIAALGTLVALATAGARTTGFVDALLGIVVGFAATYVPSVLYRLVRKRSGMGFGDAKLLVMVGAWLGWKVALFALFAGAAQSVVTAVLLRALGVSYGVPASVISELDALRARAEGGDEEAKADLQDDPMAEEATAGLLAMRLPFGPFLALGALEAALAPGIVRAAWDWVLGP
jgi:leader peptidase (prepilin peptidase)/N-methyltransferase